eukprot:m.474522 g.474522  ORF g.474522 m.474522 type:complete len:116 (-) comp36365_c0_seq1:53-400(-)
MTADALEQLEPHFPFDSDDYSSSDDGDSLGDLSEFDDEDFEAFEDSLLDGEGLNDELFGAGNPPLNCSCKGCHRPRWIRSLTSKTAAIPTSSLIVSTAFNRDRCFAEYGPPINLF